MTEQPCSKCSHYDPIKKGTSDTRRGWCAVKSIYPAQQHKGQEFPPGVKRAAPGALASPVIVVGSDVMRNCDLFRGKP